MKKLIPLIILMTMSLKGFSQIDINKSIQLKKPIAKLVIKDLITGDGAKQELSLLSNKLNLLETKIVFKDSVILNLNKSVINFESLMLTRTNQLALSQELSLKLQTDLKKQKAKTKLFQLGSGALVVGGLVLLLAK
jgi:uncharacterized coiled-coil protein SlyX|tara:strand:- start:1144 stop:1551 length:408 start_codon:yes stop_codon:yes gene_type:complete